MPTVAAAVPNPVQTGPSSTRFARKNVSLIIEKRVQPLKEFRPDFLRFGSPGRAHFVGVAGAGMRSLAAVLHAAGWDLSGSDCAAVDPSQWPFPVTAGHDPRNVSQTLHYLIHSDAIQPLNLELLAAEELGIPRRSYFQALGELMRDRIGVAVAGTHGKSTVTAMAAKCLVASGTDPTVLFGAAPLDSPHGGRFGGGRVMLVEACEFRRNFLHLTPQMAVILGIEPDHFDCYPTDESLDAAFREFASRLPADGRLLVRHDCPRARRAAEGVVCRVETFGASSEADWSYRIEDVSRGFCEISVFHRRISMLTARLGVAGRHQALNATAAAAIAANVGAGITAIRDALEGFRGIRRRLERVKCVNNVTFLDDFAHHPTEIRVTLEAVREMEPERRLVCIFQPHQAGRTAALLDETADALNNVDKLALMEIYRAREGPVRPGDVTSSDLAEAIRIRGGAVDSLQGDAALSEYLLTVLRRGDCLLAMGAGHIGRKLREALRRFEDQSSAR